MTINRLGHCVVCNEKTRGSQLCSAHAPDLDQPNACARCPFKKQCRTNVMGGNPVLCERLDDEDNNRKMYYDAYGSPDWVLNLAAAMVVGMQSGHFDLSDTNSYPYYKYRAAYNALSGRGDEGEPDSNASTHPAPDGDRPGDPGRKSTGSDVVGLRPTVWYDGVDRFGTVFSVQLGVQSDQSRRIPGQD